MKSTTTFTIYCLCSVFWVYGAYIRPEISAPERVNNILNHSENLSKDADDSPVDRMQNQRAIKPSTTALPELIPSAIISNKSAPANRTGLDPSTINLIQKVLANLRNRPITTQIPNKQFLGGKLPGFLERIVQRIQNYFSVYNPPEYFEGNRPPVISDDGIAVICSNIQDENLSCNPIPPEEYGVVQEECGNNVVTENNNQVQSPTPGEDGYNIVVTHTIVHDNLINVYSPAEQQPTGGTSQVFSNVVVILEPSAAEYSPPTEPVHNKDKFYVYVNPTVANKKKDQFQTKADTQSEKPELFQPYNNATYTVIIRGNKLQEFSNNIENTDNGALNPDISPYLRNVTQTKLYHPSMEDAKDIILNSRSIMPESKEFDVPNINVVLVPPDERANKSCSKDKYENADIEYYILKPDNGNAIKPKKPNTSNGATFIVHKTEIDATSATYLPPVESLSTSTNNKPTEVATVTNGLVANKFPLIFNLFKKKPEEPRMA